MNVKKIDKKLTCSQIKKAAIINAARLLFQKNGFKLTSMDDIAKQAGASKRTVYNHFASKELLFNAIVGEMLDLLCHFEYVDFNIDLALDEQLTRLAENELVLLKSEGVIKSSRVIISELLTSPELVEGAIQELNNRESPLVSWFRQAYSAGIIKSNYPEMVAEQFVAVIKGFCFWPQLIQGEEFPTEEKQKLVVEMAVNMIIKQYTA
ncbi:TetR/AcrR family transcriptional regulator [Psychromonas sp. KJ10-10]|uniref:TetR/AcrR family transcriptional regulator n=1 Tax=Psychromonas sp. KJ10-10 TaxID=3391823 RepID=UPI0039B515C2